MPNQTTNYGLLKPTPDEFYDIEVQNENMDKIDAELKSLEQGVSGAETPEGAQKKANDAEANAKEYTDIHENKSAPHTGHEKTANKGKPGGYASLGQDGKVPASQLPETEFAWDNIEGKPNSEPSEIDDAVGHKYLKNNPHGVTKSQIGLSNVDNVKQASKAEFEQYKVYNNADKSALRANFIDLAIELETMKAADLTGVDANIFIETFQNLDDIVLERGGYDALNKRLEV